MKKEIVTDNHHIIVADNVPKDVVVFAHDALRGDYYFLSGIVDDSDDEEADYCDWEWVNITFRDGGVVGRMLFNDRDVAIKWALEEVLWHVFCYSEANVMGLFSEAFNERKDPVKSAPPVPPSLPDSPQCRCRYIEEIEKPVYGMDTHEKKVVIWAKKCAEDERAVRGLLKLVRWVNNTLHLDPPTGYVKYVRSLDHPEKTAHTFISIFYKTNGLKRKPNKAPENSIKRTPHNDHVTQTIEHLRSIYDSCENG